MRRSGCLSHHYQVVTSRNTNSQIPSEVETELDECRRLASIWGPVLRALSNPERLLIVLWLAGNTSSVRDLERVTGVGQSLVSYHLQALRGGGLVTATAIGRSNH